MGKKVYHKNSKKTVSKTPKPNIRKGIKEERILFLDKVILTLYLAVGFLPHMNAFDVAITQWYYISIVNVLTLGYLFIYKNHIKIDIHNKFVKSVFFGALVFLLISCLSVVNSISVSESFVFLSILSNTLLAFFNLYIILKDRLSELFSFIAYILMCFLAIETLQVIYHFVVLKAGEPRSEEIFAGLNPTYGNRNILAASIIIKTAFTFYVLYTAKGIRDYFLSLSIIFLAIFSVLIIGSRTAIYSLPIIVSILFFGKLYLEGKDNLKVMIKRYLLPLSIITCIALVSVLSVNKINKGEMNSFNDLVFTKQKKYLYQEGSKIKSLASDSGRKKFWDAALDGFMSNPMLGVGIGNWKMISKEELVKSAKNSNHFYPRRAHNDFLQVLSEIGIFGFLVFLGLFVLVYLMLLKTLLSNGAANLRLMALVSLTGFVAYSLDSLINFPSERTPIQILGFLIIVVAFCLLERSKSIRIGLPIKISLSVLGILLIFSNYQMFVSAKYQMIVRNNIRGKNILTEKYKVGYEQMNRLYPSFPTLNFMGQPIDYSKAVLAYSEGKYMQALKHLDLAIKESPYSLEHYAFKSMIYRSNKMLKNQDSSIYFAKKVFYQRPGLINQYRILKKHYIAEKDTVKLFDLISKHKDFLPENEDVWLDKINFYLKYPKDVKSALFLIDSAKLMFPKSSRVQELRVINNKNASEVITNTDSLKLKRIELQKVLNKASKLFSQKKYNEAYLEFDKGLEMSPKNEEIRLSMALTDIKLKRYKDAIEKLNTVIQSNKVTNGKPEYNRGLCYLRLNNKKAAGVDFRASYDKGFSMAKSLDKRILNY